MPDDPTHASGVGNRRRIRTASDAKTVGDDQFQPPRGPGGCKGRDDLGRLLWLVPRPLRDLGYDAFAAIRKKVVRQPEGLCPMVPPEIGRRFGGRDHTTVIHAVEKIQRQMGERQAIYEQVTDVLQKLKLS